MNRTQMKAGRRRRAAVIAAVLVVLALSLMGMTLSGFGNAFAGEREDAVNQRDESRNRISSLTASLVGIDDELQGLFIEMEQTKADVEVAQSDLEVARENLAAAQRHLQQVSDQLEDAEALMEELNAQIEEGKVREGELTQAVGSMAREMYRGDKVSPLQIVVKAEELGEISDRAAAATALSRAQSRALDDVRTGIVTTENQSQKQEAVTERITDLKLKAEEATAQAEAAEAEVSDRLAQLDELQVQQLEAQGLWDAKKSEAERQLRVASDDLTSAAAKIAAIDLAREQERIAAEKAAAEKAAAEKAAAEAAAAAAASRPGSSSGSSSSGSSSGSSSSGSSSSGSSSSSSSGSSSSSSSSSGAVLGSPLRIPLRVTSSFGYRLHPVFGIPLLHDGTDFGAACGTPQYAARAGTVVGVGYTSRAGNYVQVNHGVIGGHSYITHYLHAQSIPVRVGQQVGPGTVIAYTGTTGASTGCHLHFSLFRDGVAVNPLNYM